MVQDMNAGQRNPNDGTVLGSAVMPLEDLLKAWSKNGKFID